jgi:hypothetical protein
MTRTNRVAQNYNLNNVNHPRPNSNRNLNRQYNVSVIGTNPPLTSGYLNVKPKHTEIDMFDDRLPTYEETFNRMPKEETNSNQIANNSTNRASNS